MQAVLYRKIHITEGRRMKIVFQGEETETGAATLGEFLEERGCAAGALAEYNGEIVPDAGSSDIPLSGGATLNVYKIVSGG